MHCLLWVRRKISNETQARFTGMHTDLKGPSFLPTDTEHSLCEAPATQTLRFQRARRGGSLTQELSLIGEVGYIPRGGQRSRSARGIMLKRNL